ncbi:MAG: MBL fold metallo-hydrolase, partial [Chloroflexi bacterium]|nr:MBL fold metallo-hydrolase [Chloroflexota bacterium]
VLQYGSVQRLAALPDEVGLYPTHGEGSFCAASGAGRSVSTIGLEKRENPVLAYSDAGSFADGQVAGLGPYPRYYAQMGPINTLGPPPLPAREVPELAPDQVVALGADTWVVDGRSRQAFAAAHVPGALGVELADDFGTWVGWLLPFSAPLALVLDRDQDVDEAVVQLGRIGFERVAGVLRGMDIWTSQGRQTASFETVGLAAFVDAVRAGDAQQVLDVRTPAEWQTGHLDGALHRFVADLVTTPPLELRSDETVWLACASGFRAAIAASLLQRAGYRPVPLASGGVPDVLEALAASTARA